MTTSYIIAGDWGTSTLRLYLIELNETSSSRIVESLDGLGVAALQNQSETNFEQVFFSLVAPWLEQYRVERVILSGMIGSTIGWREAPYTVCPADDTSHAERALKFTINGLDFAILGGLQTVNPIGQPDTMRGEETQLLGLLSQPQLTGSSTNLVALPGTHNKWALLNQGRVQNFVTGFTGELFAVLREHTILLGESEELDLSGDDFERGVTTAKSSNSAGLVHVLFSVRARQLVDGESAKASLAYLLGLIVGSDIAGAIQLLSPEPGGKIESVTIIASESLSQTYTRALACFDVSAQCVEATDVALAAYAQLSKQLSS